MLTIEELDAMMGLCVVWMVEAPDETIKQMIKRASERDISNISLRDRVEIGGEESKGHQNG